MVEYKVISQGILYIEQDLNRLAKEGWRVVSSFHQGGRVNPTVILERPTAKDRDAWLS